MEDDPREPEQTESLCDYCINRDICYEHHAMCVNFEPAKLILQEEKSEK